VNRIAVHSELVCPRVTMGHINRRQGWRLLAAVCFLTLGGLHLADAQCKVLSETSQPRQSSAPQFFDVPQFTVAGVTDASTPGGHGTAAAVKTKEALARETVSLSTPNSPSPSRSADEQALRVAAKAPENFDANYQLGKLLFSENKARESLEYLKNATGHIPA